MNARDTTHAQRVEIVERHLAGETLSTIATDMEFNFYTVRKWWRAYRREGWDGLIPRPSGPPVTGALSEFDDLVKYVALRLKREHPAWGLDVLLLHMRRRPSLVGKRLPKRTALYNYLKPYYGRFRERRLRVKRPKTKVNPVHAVHQRWQIDFKGKVQLSDQVTVQPFNACDEFTSTPLAGIVHICGKGQRGGLTSRNVQADLRMAFAQWGLPGQIRMDRDSLWVGSTRMEWPGVILLWLVGLGIVPIVNRPHCPTDNSHIERGNRTWNEHVYLGNEQATPQQLQQFTDQAWQDRREFLPSRNPHCHGKPPMIAHPELRQSPRPYTKEQEAELFDMQRVYAYLSQWEWERKVASNGYISLADYNRRVSKNHVGQVVKVRFDTETTSFVAHSVDGSELSRFTLPVISEDFILGQGVHN
jgi:transposase-like protein